MKLLFDQNISFRVLKMISIVFPDAKQVKELGLQNRTDRQIWDFAKENGFTIVTFDADFIELSNLYGTPPKLIWLRTGNRKTSYLANILINRSQTIIEFLSNSFFEDIACLEIDD